ncbi:uncharacterized protein BBA_04934 [Beauveria bassiana ARSEF 2860]|uniref:Uncharacterized protein n=1 Tax=Beauveria bassiana (strain ARSEF 2860) TaxID=655819 RepID=J5JKL2_BEAB2|nr:uncharacterized protein BBA_04934 [Beauveria bassiana ARSEF 2860]EJP65963.1 hypothetical protein BBA_04934 [Beauveria bassiana ARSEF 2860]
MAQSRCLALRSLVTSTANAQYANMGLDGHEIGVPYVNMEPRDDVVYKQEQTVQELPFPLAVHQSRRPCRRTRPPTRITTTVTGCVLPSAPMADHNHDASTPCSSTTSTSSLDRKTQPVVVQLTRVAAAAAAAAASSTQAAGDLSSYLALKSCTHET